MGYLSRSSNNFSVVHKNVQASRLQLPQSALTLEALKVTEKELRRRGHITGDDFFPLWFHAETERNIFLWRRGCSLIQADEFEFWVDVQKLTEKRLTQLGRHTHSNPFNDPNWGMQPSSDSVESGEQEYLLNFATMMKSMKAHIQALSYAGALISQDIEPALQGREVVVLPASPRSVVSQ